MTICTRIRAVVPALCAALALLASPAAAEDASSSGTPGVDPVQAALMASRVLETHCMEVAAGAATRSALALSAVSPALTTVSAAHDETGEAYLLFWRGRLNLCLDREERAQEDLQAFVDQVGENPTYAPQVQQARRLIRRIERAHARPAIRTPALAVTGGALLGGAGALAALSGWQWSVAIDKQAQHDAGNRPWVETQLLAQEGQQALTAQRVLAGSAVAPAVGGVLSFVLSTVPSKGAPKAGPAAAVAVPTPDGGAALVLVGRF